MSNDQARIRDEAVEWVVHLSLDELSDDQRLESLQRFQHWVQADPRHRGAYERAQDTWFSLADLKEYPEAGPLVSAQPAAPGKAPAPQPDGTKDSSSAPEPPTPPGPAGDRERRAAPGALRRFLAWFTAPRLALGAVTAGAAALLLTTLVPALLTEPPAATRYSTRTGEIRELTLADGSQVTLGARSSLTVVMDANTRQVELLAGDAFFDVTKNPERPFVVSAGQAKVTVVGTRFDLQRGPRQIDVAVEEGVVEVQLSPPKTGRQTNAAPVPASVTLTAGQRVAARDTRLTPVTTFDPASARGWRSGRFQYEDATLAEIIADANRYSETPITFSDDSLGELTITTVYQVGQLEQMLRTFELVLPIEATETPMGVILKPKK